MKKLLMGNYAIEVLNGRLNTSSEEVEKSNCSIKNLTFTKKVQNKGYVSANCIKYNMKKYLSEEGWKMSTSEKVGETGSSKVEVEGNPYRNFNEDVFGFMNANKITISSEEYEQLTEQQQKLFKKDKKSYSRNATAKRIGRFQSNGLIGVTSGRVAREFGVCRTSGDNMLYQVETYSDVLAGIFNLDVSNVGKFTHTDKTTEFRDYSEEEYEALEIRELTKEERLARINATLEAIENLSIKSNQTNYLVDTTPKLLIMAEFNNGNNVLQGLINREGINVEGIKEVISQFGKHMTSDMWIGVSERIANEDLKKKIKEQVEELKLLSEDLTCIKVGSVQDAFEGYKKHLESTLE